jgi:hypothetical protein
MRHRGAHGSLNDLRVGNLDGLIRIHVVATPKGLQDLGNGETVAGIISGVYKCKAQGISFSYEVWWDLAGDIIQWQGRLSHDRVLVTAEMKLAADPATDAPVSVRRAVEEWIEGVSCESVAARVGPPRPE